jgi:uncharacterized RmlC-like cupin family protein
MTGFCWRAFNHEQETYPPAEATMSDSTSRWRSQGVRVVAANQLDDATAQTLGMRRRAAITTEKTGATKLWAGTVTIDAKAKTGPHHHGDLESVIYVVNGVARLRWGERLEFVAEAQAGDFIYVPPFVPHQEINASEDLQLHCVLARSGQTGLVYNLDIEPVEIPELVRWIDDLHS